MKTTIFAKKKTTREGKPFIAYVAKLARKDGSTITASVRFREECGSPKADICPCIIEFPKDKANLSETTYTREDTGEDAVAYKLWVSEWKLSEEVYEDHSLDDFE